MTTRQVFLAGARAGIALVAIFACISTASAATIVVGRDVAGQRFMKNIAEAVSAAKPGDTVEVPAGRYEEKITLDKSIHVKGIDYPEIVTKSGHIFLIKAPNVTVEGFSLKSEGTGISTEDAVILVEQTADAASIIGNRFSNIMTGIRDTQAPAIRIENNTMTGRRDIDDNNRGNCITLVGVQHARVVANKLNYCRDAVFMEICHDAEILSNEVFNSRYALHTMWVDRGKFNGNFFHDNLVGLAIMYTKQSEINDNVSVGNNTHGLLLIQTVRSQVRNNTLIGNTKGVFLYNSIYNDITGNLIMNNNMGLHSWGGSEDNTITKNSFINNEIQVKFVAGKNQQWNENYWSDYLGWDMKNEGRGQVPYESNTVVDHLFWRYPMSKILYSSPAMHLLWVLEKQFPMMKTPRVVDMHPYMEPPHADWKKTAQKYAAFSPKKITPNMGNMDKLQNAPGGF
jgi:nitrous oxidase accessory protein